MRVLLLFLLIYGLLFAKERVLSSIPPAKNVFIDLNATKCDRECLQELIDNGKIISFLTRYKNHSQYDDIQSVYEKYSEIFRIAKEDNLEIKIAMLIPQKIIRRYAISTVNSVLSYLIYKKYNFNLKVYNCENENSANIINSLNQIRKDGYAFVIAPVTDNGIETLIENSQNLTIYVPTVNKQRVRIDKPNIIFGGISYKKQIEKLLEYANEKIAIFSDSSMIARELNNDVRDLIDNYVIYEKVLKKSKQNFKKMLKWNKRLDNSSVFLNLPLVKSSLLLSQFRVYGRKPYRFLSTQINFNPMLLTLTQYQDRKNMILANSIGETNAQINQTNSILGSDIEYDWVNYSTTIGIDIFYNRYFTPNEPFETNHTLINNQIQYEIDILQPQRHSFEHLQKESL